MRNEIIEVGAVKLDYHGNVMGEFSQFVQTEFTEGVAFPVRELTGISAVDTAMADPLYMVIKGSAIGSVATPPRWSVGAVRTVGSF